VPFSYDTFDNVIVAWVWQNVKPLSPILDVGAGAGKYGKLLRATHTRIDALEIYEPNIKQFRLGTIYRRVVQGDIRSYDATGYALVIMGDVLEHLSATDGAAVLTRIACPVIVQVPFRYSQGAEGGNSFEAHLQPDLTPEVMLTRYTMLTPLAPVQPNCGAFLKV